MFYFFLLGEGERGVRGVGGGRGGGVDFFIWKSQERGVQKGEGPSGRKGACGELGNLGAGGAKYFFGGPTCPPEKKVWPKSDSKVTPADRPQSDPKLAAEWYSVVAWLHSGVGPWESLLSHFRGTLLLFLWDSVELGARPLLSTCMTYICPRIVRVEGHWNTPNRRRGQ